MNPMTRRLLPLFGCVLGLGAASAALAQPAQDCPRLPADSGLSWSQRGNDAFLICSAVAADGTEAFGISLSADSAFQPRRANREERGVVAGRDIRWYRAEVGAQPDVLVRETLVELDRGRVAHIWMRTLSEEDLRRTMGLVERLDFSDSRVTSN